MSNYQKWRNYYDKILDDDKRTDVSMVKDLFYTSDSSKHGGSSNVSLNLVSPVKMLTEQAENEIGRSDTDGAEYKSPSKEKLVQKRRSNRRGNNKRRPKKARKSKTRTKKKRSTTNLSRKRRTSKKVSRKKDIFEKA